jgi:hypothetical protein
VSDELLLAKVRGRTPGDPAVRACWDAIVLGVLGGRLGVADLARLAVELRAGLDVELGTLTFAVDGDRVEISDLGRPGGCRVGALTAELDRLLAPPPDPADLFAAPLRWIAAAAAELPYRARWGDHTLLIRTGGGRPRYTLQVDGAALTGFDDWPVAWVRPAAVDPAAPADAAVVRVWAERLCRAAAGDPEGAAQTLGLVGGIVADGTGTAVAFPPPTGVDRLELSSRDGRVESVTARFAWPGPTRGDFDAYFGHGRWLPRVHPGDDHRLGYDVVVPGGSTSCAVLPSFPGEPADGTVATAVLIRRDRP